LSKNKRKKLPATNPNAAGNHIGRDFPCDISMAGASREKKLAAIIIPAANPSMLSKSFLLGFLLKKTKEAPSAVTDHVKQVARRAWRIGLSCCNWASIEDMLF